MIQENNTYNVVIRSIYVEKDNTDLSRHLSEELKLNANQCEYILNNVPIILYKNITDDEVDVIKPRLDLLMQNGVHYEILKENEDNIAVFDWKNTDSLKEKNEAEIELNTKIEKAEIPVESIEPAKPELSNEIIIQCPCANCGSVMKIVQTLDGIEIMLLTSATKNPLTKKSDDLSKRKYTNEQLTEIAKAVDENVYGGIEQLQDLPTKPTFKINFEEYGFKSMKHFMEYQNSLIVGKSLESWTGGN